MKEYYYRAHIIWTGNQGTGTSGYREYLRDYEIKIDSKSIIKGSSDPAFRGNPTLHNPEKLFLASLSFCHMLWFLIYVRKKGFEF
jgi:organic hydroperoxide reductase OsmC/OhrA